MLPLFLTQFLLMPALVALLLPFLPPDPLLRLGVLLVLLSPCIDYVVTFAQLGRADARLLLAATPLLLLVQALLLPLYLHLFLGELAADVVRPAPFIAAFIGLIVLPLGLAALTQRVCRRRRYGQAIAGDSRCCRCPLPPWSWGSSSPRPCRRSVNPSRWSGA
ncbi:hypothetical protein N4G58_08505 [Edwardsiella piscicida]|nr:hypothetical protein N4G58_08505 [Edwardsiella piscicida]